MKKGTVVTSFINFKKAGGLETLREDINKALESVGFKYGIKLHAGKCGYQDTFAEYKLLASVISADGLVETKEAKEYREVAKYVQVRGESDVLKPEWLNKQFFYKDRNYTIVGLRSGRRNPVLCSRQDGKQFFFAAEAVVTCMKHYAKKAA